MRKFAPLLVSGVMAVSFSTLAFSQGASVKGQAGAGADVDVNNVHQRGVQNSQQIGGGNQQSEQYGSGSQSGQGSGSGSQANERDRQYGSSSSGASGDERHDNGKHKGWYKNKDKDRDADRDRRGGDDSRRGRSG